MDGIKTIGGEMRQARFNRRMNIFGASVLILTFIFAAYGVIGNFK